MYTVSEVNNNTHISVNCYATLLPEFGIANDAQPEFTIYYF